MRVLQLIDSLRPGGAERMAVNYANALVGSIDASFICCTRLEGNLKKEVRPEVGYLFLKKGSVLDLKAFFKLRSYVLENKIEIIQAHGSSFFLASLVKRSLQDLKLIWHDHWGGRAQKQKAQVVLKKASYNFDGIITVNESLTLWAKDKLRSGRVVFIPNFLSAYTLGDSPVKLKGEGAFKIICVANFRPEKDHLNLLAAFDKLVHQEKDISLHLIGKDEKDAYSTKIKNYIHDYKLQEKVFIYGLQGNVPDLLVQADLGIVSSVSEGLPVALLEYGMAGLPVVATAVGEVPQVLKDSGKLVPPSDPSALAQAILFYLGNESRRTEDAGNFQKKIIAEYSQEAVLPQILEFYRLITATFSESSGLK